MRFGVLLQRSPKHRGRRYGKVRRSMKFPILQTLNPEALKDLLLRPDNAKETYFCEPASSGPRSLYPVWPEQLHNIGALILRGGF